MYRRVDCRKYWKWKRAQEKKSKQDVKKAKKPKRKERVTDCIDEDEEDVPEAAVKLNYRRCKKKRKRKRPRTSRGQTFKLVSLEDLVLKSIKPPLEVREYLLNPRHTACLRMRASKMDIPLEIVETAMSLLSQTSVAGQSMDRRKRKRRKRAKDDENEGTSKKSSRKIEESDSEDDSDCKSVCSSDSEVCLAGTKLTPKDKEQIKKYQQQIQEAANKED